MLHESGTGGAPKYGVVSQMPANGEVDNPLLDYSDTRAADDVARLGYYKVSLSNGTVLELASTNRAGLYNYTFPSTVTSPNVIVDVSHVLPSFRGQGLGQNYLGGEIAVFPSADGSSLQYEGSGSYDNVGIPIVSAQKENDLRNRVSLLLGMEPGPGMDCLFLWLL
jgi:hypothetical protein